MIDAIILRERQGNKNTELSNPCIVDHNPGPNEAILNSGLTLTLLRHAKSDWANANLDDHDRPLNARGRRSAPLIGKYIEDKEIPIDVVLASTATRAQQTLELVVSSWNRGAPELFSTSNLYLASPRKIIDEIQKLPTHWRSVLVVGHNPGMGELASILAGEEFDFPTACLASFEISVENWQQFPADYAGQGKLVQFCCPRELE